MVSSHARRAHGAPFRYDVFSLRYDTHDTPRFRALHLGRVAAELVLTTPGQKTGASRTGVFITLKEWVNKPSGHHFHCLVPITLVAWACPHVQHDPWNLRGGKTRILSPMRCGTHVSFILSTANSFSALSHLDPGEAAEQLVRESF